MSDELTEDLYEDWKLQENEKMYAGFSAAAVPEAISKGLNYSNENISLWDQMTQYGLDKVSHFGFSFFGAKALMKGSETFPEYMKRMENSEAPLSDQVHSAGVKLSEPSMQQKTLLALTGVAVLGYGKELTDAYIDMYDMAANMTGASTAILEEYGEGSVKKGAEKTFQDIRQLLENEETETVAEPTLDAETRRQLEDLGKL